MRLLNGSYTITCGAQKELRICTVKSRAHLNSNSSGTLYFHASAPFHCLMVFTAAFHKETTKKKKKIVLTCQNHKVITRHVIVGNPAEFSNMHRNQSTWPCLQFASMKMNPSAQQHQSHWHVWEPSEKCQEICAVQGKNKGTPQIKFC